MSRQWERRMDAEMRHHIEAAIERHMSEGLSREEAEMRTRAEFGPVELAKDECRDERSTAWLETLWRDARYASRSLARSPGFTAAAIVTLALGTGANTAIFSVVHAVLLKPLPYTEPERISSVEVSLPGRKGFGDTLPATVQAYLEWRKAETAFGSMAALRPWECNLTGDGEAERTGGARVSTNFFEFLGVPVAHGRGFTADEGQLGKERVVVMSDALWRRRYGADPAVVGKSISINGERHLVVGIASPSLLVPTGSQLHPVLPFASRVDIWKPIAPTERELQSESWDHGVLARLAPGASAEQGQQQLQNVLNAFIRAQVPEFKDELSIRLVPLTEIYSGKVRLRLLLVFAASGLLLLTACVNIANLFLARMASRAKEFATRIALGAGRLRLLSHVLAETSLISLAGGGLGVFIAFYGAEFLRIYGPDDVRALTGASLDLPVLLFGLAASVGTGVGCGLYPALRAGVSPARFRQILVGAEMALSTALLASAGLLLHSFVNVSNADRGYQVERVLAADLSLFGQRYSKSESRVAYYRNLTTHVRALPGVLAAGAISDLPAATAGPSGGSRTIFHSTDTNFAASVMSRPTAMIRAVTEGYFAASGTSLRAGRFPDANEPIPTAVISQSLATRLWPGEQLSAVVGRTFRQGNVTGPLITIAGVVEDVRPGGADRDLPPFVYRPYEQWASGPATLVLRTAQDPAALAPAVRAEIRRMDPNLPITSIRTMREIVSASLSARRFQMTLTLLFAAVALLLGAAGVYGVVSYAVASRRRDIGLRMALGAMSRDIMRWVFGYGMRPVLAGLVAGLAAAVAIATGLRSVLYGVSPADPVSLVSVALILLVVSGLACYLPARRASRVDPLIALRHD